MPQMTVEQFGQTIKAKHPEYGDMADADVGKRVLTKYPQYGDMVQGFQAPTPPRPAGLPAGVDLPQPNNPAPVDMQAPPSLMSQAKSNFNANTQAPPPPTSFANMLSPKRALQNIGAGAGDTVRGLYHMATDPLYDPSTPAPTAEQIAAQGAQQIHQFGQDPVAAYARAGGQAATGALLGAAGGKVIGAATDAVRPMVNAAGDTLQNLAFDNLNRRMSIGPKDQQYGQNPARGILKSGIGVSTQKGLQQKVAGAMDANGKVLSNLVQRADVNANAPTITPGQLRPFIEGPVNAKRAVVQGIGNHVADPEGPLNTFLSKAQQPAPGATASIYGPNAPSSIPPSDLWKSIRNIDANTRFNPQPEIESVNEVGRDVRGGLRTQLESIDPSIKPVSQNYSDLATAQTALDRQQSPFYAPKGLQALIHSTLDSYPVRTAASSGLYGAGSALKNVAGTAAGPAALPFSYRMQPQPLRLAADVPGNAGYGADFTQGNTPARNPLVPPAPKSYAALPPNTTASDVQGMIAMKAAPSYPSLYDPTARTRIEPTMFNGPPTNPLGRPIALLPARTTAPRKR